LDRVGLVKELATETGLRAADIRNVLNALVLLMNRDIQSGGNFEMPAAVDNLPATTEKKPLSTANPRMRGQIPPIALAYENTFTPDAKPPKRRGQIPPPPR
jgi:nucleoid DNA-binding protein